MRRTTWQRGAAMMILVLLAVSASCMKRTIRPREPDTIVVRVTNNNALDVTVYAVNQSMRVRLGTVTTASTAHFALALHSVSPTGDLQLLADPIGSRRTVTSETIHVFAGQVVEWVLTADLRTSTLSIRS